MSSSEETTPDFDWRDLEAEEVYHVAHEENELRNQVAGLLGQAAFASNIQARVEDAQTLMANHETRAASWLADQAMIRGRTVARMQANFGAWLDERIREKGLTYRGLSEIVGGASIGYLHALRKGRYTATRAKVVQIATGIADSRELEGKERKTFINDAIVQAGYLVDPQ